MQTDATQVAAPSAAASEPLSVPTDAEGYGQWRMTGKLPPKTEAPAASKEVTEPTKKDEAAASKESSEAPKKQPKEPEASPSPELGIPEHQKRGKLSATERAEQLRTENRELEAELKRRADLRKQLAETPDDKKAEASTAKPAKQEPNGLVAPVKPKWDDFKDKENGYEEYEAARDDYQEKRTQFAVDKALADERQRQQLEAAQREIAESVKEAKKRYPDFDQVIAPTSNTMFSDPQIPGIVKAMVNESDVMADLLYTLGHDKGEFQDFLDLAKNKPLDAVRKLALIENEVRNTLGKAVKPDASDDGGAKVRNEKGQFQKAEDEPQKTAVPEKKVISTAPPLTDEVGGRGSIPPDPVQAAAKQNDFRAFRDGANRRDLNRRQGR